MTDRAKNGRWTVGPGRPATLGIEAAPPEATGPGPDEGPGPPCVASAGGVAHGGPVKLGNGASGVPPAAPVAPICMKQSTARPDESVSTDPSAAVCSPAGTNSSGWSNGADWSRTRGSVSASRNATSWFFSVSLRPRFVTSVDCSAVGKFMHFVSVTPSPTARSFDQRSSQSG